MGGCGVIEWGVELFYVGVWFWGLGNFWLCVVFWSIGVILFPGLIFRDGG
jgi:hypothetical protein